MRMSPQARREVAAIVLVTALTGAFSARLPHRLPLGDLLLGAAALLLLQGLVRDIGRWMRTRSAPPAAPRVVRCVCVESTLGVTAILAGCVLLFAWTPLEVRVGAAGWILGVSGLGAFGFMTRDLVVDWGQRRIRREPDHGAVVSWRG